MHQLSCQRLCHQFLYVYFFQGIRFTLIVNGEVFINETLSGKMSFFKCSLKILNKQAKNRWTLSYGLVEERFEKAVEGRSERRRALLFFSSSAFFPLSLLLPFSTRKASYSGYSTRHICWNTCHVYALLSVDSRNTICKYARISTLGKEIISILVEKLGKIAEKAWREKYPQFQCQ